MLCISCMGQMWDGSNIFAHQPIAKVSTTIRILGHRVIRFNSFTCAYIFANNPINILSLDFPCIATYRVTIYLCIISRYCLIASIQAWLIYKRLSASYLEITLPSNQLPEGSVQSSMEVCKRNSSAPFPHSIKFSLVIYEQIPNRLITFQALQVRNSDQLRMCFVLWDEPRASSSSKFTKRCRTSIYICVWYYNGGERLLARNNKSASATLRERLRKHGPPHSVPQGQRFLIYCDLEDLAHKSCWISFDKVTEFISTRFHNSLWRVCKINAGNRGAVRLVRRRSKCSVM